LVFAVANASMLNSYSLFALAYCNFNFCSVSVSCVLAFSKAIFARILSTTFVTFVFFAFSSISKMVLSSNFPEGKFLANFINQEY
jgi:hypothetical protein